MTSKADPKAGVRAHLDKERAGLVDLSHRIHANPEIGYEEEKASAWLSALLDDRGFAVERGVAGLPTAFKATYGSGDLNIGICAEYDALPSIGHACGHNVIATSSLGAALALARVADDIGVRVTVLGTPAEEVLRKGGKVVMLEHGAFADVHAAMMVHPGPFDLAGVPLIAAAFFEVRYRGKESHASGAPHQGINAADAMTVAQTAIGLLRQQLRPTDRVHGIVRNGGAVFNVIPAFTSADYGVRATTLDELQDVRLRVLRCFEAGALATGAQLEVAGGDRPYAHMVHDPEMSALYKRNAQALGRAFADDGGAMPHMPVSSDMGNVSHVVPSIHPGIAVCPPNVFNHQPAFAAYCATPTADQALYDAALAMAWTAIDLATTRSSRGRLLARRP